LCQVSGVLVSSFSITAQIPTNNCLYNSVVFVVCGIIALICTEQHMPSYGYPMNSVLERVLFMLRYQPQEIGRNGLLVVGNLSVGEPGVYAVQSFFCITGLVYFR